MTWCKYILIFLLSISAFGQSNYSQYRIIVERNIFAPDRGNTNSVSYRTNYEIFSLVGIMHYETNTLAFFEGINSARRQVLCINDHLAHYTVSDISTNTVTLTSSNETVVMTVGTSFTNPLSGKVPLTTRKPVLH